MRGGPTYKYTEIEPVNNQEGGQPGGNIRVGFIYNPDRVSLKGGKATGGSQEAVGYEDGDLTLNPGRIDPTNAAFDGSRVPLAAEFTFQGEDVVVVLNHFNSKGGDDALYGLRQPAERGSEEQRHKIANVVNGFVDDIMTKDPDANVVVMGDLNDFQFSETLNILEGNVLTNKVNSLSDNEQYTYVFQGNSQALDHILVNNELAANTELDIVHMNAEFSVSEGQASDHDPLLAQIDFGIEPISDAEAVSQVIESLSPGFASGDYETSVRSNLTLPTSGTDGTTITWETSDASVLTTEGNVTRPDASSEDALVTLTATVKKNEEEQTETFDLTVKSEVGVISAADARVLEDNSEVKVSGTIVGINDKNYYIQDQSGGIVVRDTAGKLNAEVGDVIEAYGTKAVFNGNAQVEAAASTDIIITEEDTELPTPELITADKLEANIGKVVTIEDIKVTTEASYGEFNAQDGAHTNLIIDNEFIEGSVTANTNYESITGVIVKTYNQVKLAPRTEADVVLGDNPVEEPAEPMDVPELLISQYTKTDSGTSPKGIELWNPGTEAIDFSVTPLTVLQGTNGGTLSEKVTIDTGTLQPGGIMVIGTSNMGTYLEDQNIDVPYVDESFTFNGDDALQIQLSGQVVDTFGDVGTDPGDEWSGNGVSSKDQNISIKSDINTGDKDGWTDPSERFTKVDVGSVLTGFGIKE